MHWVVWHGLVAKADGLAVGTEDQKLLVAEDLEDFLVESDRGFVIVHVDAHLGVVDHLCEGSEVRWDDSVDGVFFLKNWMRCAYGEVGPCHSLQNYHVRAKTAMLYRRRCSPDVYSVRLHVVGIPPHRSACGLHAVSHKMHTKEADRFGLAKKSGVSNAGAR